MRERQRGHGPVGKGALVVRKLEALATVVLLEDSGAVVHGKRTSLACR